MIDNTLRSLWQMKDDVAKEHGYDLDALVSYLQIKANSSNSDLFDVGTTNRAEQIDPADV